MAEQEKIQPGKLIVRQVSGTDGTHEVQISHDGTSSVIESKFGNLTIPTDLTITGSTTLSSTLNGILKTSNGTISGSATFNDLVDVIISTPALNDTIIYDGSAFINSQIGVTSGVQPYDADLTTIAGLTHTSGNVIRSNGTVWQSTTLSFNDLGDVTITSLSIGDIVSYNGTNWVNSLPGATSGVQPYDADLTTIAGLTAGDGNFIVGDGTNWTTESGNTARTSLGLGTGDSPTFVTINATTSVVTPAVNRGSSGVVSLFTDAGTNNITVGGSNSTVVIAGNLQVDGTTTTINSTSLNITDKNITVNKSGTTAAATQSGLNIEGDSAAIVGYFRSATDNANLELKAPTGSILTIDMNANHTIALGSASSNDMITYNGTNFVNSPISLDNLSDVTISSPSINQVITYNGTNWSNNTVTGGGDPLDSYFNPANTIIDRTDLNSTSLTNAYQYTGTGRAVVTSIHVTNIEGTSEYEIDSIITDNSDGTTDFYIGKAIPLPAATSIELLHRPKVLEQNDRLKFKANTASKLQVVATIAPFDSNTKLFNKFLSINSTSQQTVYTESNSAGSVIESILLSNDSTSANGVQISVYINNGTNDTALSYLLNIPQKATVELCAGPKFLPNTGTIKVTASDIDSCDVAISGRKL